MTDMNKILRGRRDDDTEGQSYDDAKRAWEAEHGTPKQRWAGRPEHGRSGGGGHVERPVLADQPDEFEDVLRDAIERRREGR